MATSLLSEAKGNKFSLVSGLEDRDVVFIWRIASQFVKKQMLRQKGVVIPGLGTFTFSQVKLSMGKNKSFMIQRPIFVFSEWFLQTHGLTCTKHHASGHIPVMPLNYTALSNEGPYNRDSLQSCVKEILLTLSQCLFGGKNIHLDFYEVGRIIIKDSRIQMKFFRNFINELDFNTNGELEKAFSGGARRSWSEMSIIANPVSPQLSRLPRLVHSVKSATPMQPDHAISAVCSKPENCAEKTREMSPQAVSSKSQCSTRQPNPKSPDSLCDHRGDTRQGLCYFCHQQNKRNLYVDTSIERKAKEINYEKVLHDYQEKKHFLASAKEREAKKISESFAKDASLYNYRLSQEKKCQGASKVFHPSYIFQHRALSPDKRAEQALYCSQLHSQIKDGHQIQEKNRKRQEQLDRKEHEELNKRLQALEEIHLKENSESVTAYKKALTEQIHAKLSTQQHGRAESIYPVFGVQDGSVDMPKEKEARKNAFIAHLQKVREKQQKIKEEASKVKQEEAEIFEKAKHDLFLEIQRSNHDRSMRRKRLEDSWANALHKRKEIYKDMKDPELLLLEQCEKYRRCQRCHRRRENRGESSFHVL